MFFRIKKGIIKRLEFPEWFKTKKDVVSYDFYYKTGDTASYPVKSHPERLGFFLIVSDKKKNVQKYIIEAYKDIIVEIV